MWSFIYEWEILGISKTLYSFQQAFRFQNELLVYIKWFTRDSRVTMLDSRALTSYLRLTSMNAQYVSQVGQKDNKVIILDAWEDVHSARCALFELVTHSRKNL